MNPKPTRNVSKFLLGVLVRKGYSVYTYFDRSINRLRKAYTEINTIVGKQMIRLPADSLLPYYWSMEC